MKQKKKAENPKTEYCSMYDIFPWLRGEMLSEAEYKKRHKNRAAMEKAHPRAKPKAWGADENWEYEIEGFDPGVIIKDPVYFIDSADLDNAQRKAYESWMYGQTRPLIPGVNEASYPSDYSRFYDSYVQGKTAIIND